MSGFTWRLVAGLFFCAILCAADRAQGWHHLGNVQSVEKLNDGVELTAGPAKVRITSFKEGVVRVRVAPSGKFPEDFSWAIVKQPQPTAVSSKMPLIPCA